MKTKNLKGLGLAVTYRSVVSLDVVEKKGLRGTLTEWPRPPVEPPWGPVLV